MSGTLTESELAEVIGLSVYSLVFEVTTYSHGLESAWCAVITCARWTLN